MATWGALVSSYVKKNNSNAVPPVQEVTDKPSPFTIKPYKAELNNGPSQDSFGLKRADTRAKKLYTSPAESTTSVDELPQRSNSNAARVAKMFGYTGPAPAPALSGVVSDAVKAARAESKLEEKIQAVADLPSSPVNVEVSVVQEVRTESNSAEKLQSSRRPPAQAVAPLQLKPRVTAKTEQSITSSPSRTSPTQPAPSSRRQPSLDKGQMAKQNPMGQAKAKVVKAAKPSISSLDDIMSLLENETFILKSSNTGKEKAPVQSSIERVSAKQSKAPKPSISSLDEMMSLLEQDWDVGSSSVKDSAPYQNPPTTIAEQNPSGLQVLKEEPERNSSATIVFGFVEEPEEMEVEMDSEANAPTYRKDSFASSSSFALSEPRSIFDFQEDIRVQIGEEGSEPSEKPILDYMKEAEEMKLERDRMEFERQQILEEELAFEREAERFAEEEEQMRRFVENLKREEATDFENEERKRRIAEEKKRAEEAERKRLQDLEDERLAIEMAERLNLENERIERERRGKEKTYQERVDMERARYVEEEARLREQRMEEERKARQEEEREEEARLEAERMENEEKAKRKRRAEEKRLERERYEEEARQIEDERIAREKRRAAKAKAERMRYEEEEAQRDFERRENERIVQERRRVERQRVERVRHEQERSALEARQRENERMKYDEQDSEPEVLTKEQELAKAEEKIRAAFAGLAQERDQLSKGVKPASGGSKLQKGRMDAPVDRERGVSRYNTVAAGARTRQESATGVSRVNTVGVKPNRSIGGGLPTGPRAGGFGLPGGPRAGLPSGPKPRGRI